MNRFLLPFVSLLAMASGLTAAPLRVTIVAAKADADAAAADDIAGVLRQRGAEVESAEAIPDEAKLAQTDVLVLAGDEPKATAENQRVALQKYAGRGGGIVVVAGAIGSADAGWWKPLVGGAWTAQSRKFANKLMLFTLTDSHPITRNVSPFNLDDETYYDLETDPAIHVLASAFTPKVTARRADRRAAQGADRANVYDLQPQMWAFEPKEGTPEAAQGPRAFVLLPAKAESWRHVSVRSMLLRGVAWAGKRENVDELCSKEELATLRYPAGGPRPAAETVKSFEMQPGFKATAIAAEPLVTKPIAMQWDPRGRLWIAETPEYPNGRRPLTTDAWKETGVLFPGKYDRPAMDRISILSEPDANGQFTKKTVFHQGLELITGFCLYGDGVIVVAQPDIVFIHGEGASQRVERLYTGFTPGDTHFVANHFIASPDGWIYANTGSGPKAESVSHPEVKAQLSSGVFRFKPDGSAIEQVSSKGGNAFGLDITSDGEIFFGQATSGNPVQHVVLPEWILTKGKTAGVSGAESVIKGRKVVRPDMPDRAPFMQIDVVGGYSAACASTVYEAGSWPAEWRGGVFCTEPILDIIHFEKLVPSGATFTGEMVDTSHEWLRARDDWFFPVDVEFGPDGAMYVLDFYCPIVAHNDTRGPLHSRSGASVRPDRDHYFGRIYRIQTDAAQQLETVDFATATPSTLVQAFTHPNKLIRFTAHRLLMERADAASAVPQLMAMAKGEKFAPARILALWALQRLGQLPADVLDGALESDDAGVRKSALLVVEARGANGGADLASMLKDADARVRLDALRAMASSALTPDSAAALLAVLSKLDDPWSRSAAIAAASSNPEPIIEAALASHEPPSNALLDLTSSLAAAITEKQDSGALGAVIVAVSKASPEAAPVGRTVLEAAARAIPAAPQGSPALEAALRALLVSPDPVLSADSLPFAVAWRADALRVEIAPQLSKLLAVARDGGQPENLRAAAVAGLIRSRTADATILASVLDLLKTKLSDALMVDVINALASTGDPQLGKPIVALLPNLPALGQAAAFDALTTRAEWANAVLDALQARELSPTLLGPARLSKLRLHSDPAIAKRALKLIDELGGGANPAKEQVIAKLESEVEKKAGDPAKGKITFNATCAICHRFNGEGKEVGPLLDGIGVHGTHELLTHIIDPSRVVDNEHRTWNIALKNGSFATGLIARENERSLTLRMAGGIEQEIRVADIKSRQDSGLSLMPEGFEALGADMLRDVLAYLAGGSAKYRAINLTRVFTTDTGAGLYHSREAKNDSIPPVHFGVVTVESVPFSLPDPTTTPTGGNVVVLRNSNGRDYASTLPQRVEIPVGFAAGNLHFLGGVAGWGGPVDAHQPAMKVTIEHTDGKSQVEELYTGDTFIDYPSGDDVPGSKRAEGIVQRHHVRYFWLPVADRSPISKVILESYLNGIAPTTLAITADTDAAKPRPKFEPAAVSSVKEEKGKSPLPKTGETLPSAADPRMIRALLVGGGSSHDFEKFFHQSDAATLKGSGQIVTAYTSNLEEALAQIPNADVMVLSANHPQFGTPDFQKALNAFADAGHGLVVVHAGTWYNWAPETGYNQRFVGGGAKGHGRGEFAVYNKQSAHPVMKGLPAEFKITDEHYRIYLDAGTPVEVLAETEPEKETKQPHPAVWVVKDPKCRIVGISLGHDERAHDLAEYQKLLVNAVEWVSGKQQ